MGCLNTSSPQPPRRFFASALLLLWPLISAAAQYRVESWTTDNGLPQNSVRSIIQTRDGYLWLSTFDGLVRFDGLHFTVFDKSNTKGLSTNRFTSLYEDKDGTLWIGTGDGGLTFYRAGVFRSITVADGIPAGQVMALEPDLKGELLVTIDAKRFYFRDGKFIAAPSEYNSHEITNYRAPSGSQWTITANGARVLRNGQVTQYPLPLDFARGVSPPYEDSQGNLWLGTASGVYRLHDGTSIRYEEKDGVPPRTLLRPGCEDDEGGVWFIGSGLVSFQRRALHDLSRFSYYRHLLHLQGS